MENLPGDQWKHTTAPDLLTYDHEVVGIDLFDEEYNGEVQTAIYQRFDDGARWPARTVTRTNLQHHHSVVEAWCRKGEVHDYRASAIGMPWDHVLRLPKAKIPAVVEAIKASRRQIEVAYLERLKNDPNHKGSIAVTGVIARPRSIVVRIAHTHWDYRINVISEVIGEFIPANLGVQAAT